MFIPYRLGPLATHRGSGTVKARWRGGLFYYAPLTDLFEPLTAGNFTGAQGYGNTIRDTIRFVQNTGVKDGFAFSENVGTCFRIQTSGNNPHLTFPPAWNGFMVSAPMTVAGWVRPGEIASLGGIAAHNQGGVGNNYSLFWDNTGAMFMSFTVGGVFKSAASAANTVKLNVWQFWVGTYDQSFIRIYRDGVLMASTAEAGVPDSPVTSHVMGSADVTAFASRALLLRHVAVWSGRALKGDEIAQMYREVSLFEDGGNRGRALENPSAWLPSTGAEPPASGTNVDQPVILGMGSDRYAAARNIHRYPVFGM